jgi:hypothetical protein
VTVTKHARDERVESAYWQYVLEHHLEPSNELLACYAAAWRAGGKQLLHDSAELAGLVPALRELIAWLENE